MEVENSALARSEKLGTHLAVPLVEVFDGASISEPGAVGTPVDDSKSTWVRM